MDEMMKIAYEVGQVWIDKIGQVSTIGIINQY